MPPKWLLLLFLLLLAEAFTEELLAAAAELLGAAGRPPQACPDAFGCYCKSDDYYNLLLLVLNSIILSPAGDSNN